MFVFVKNKGLCWIFAYVVLASHLLHLYRSCCIFFIDSGIPDGI